MQLAAAPPQPARPAARADNAHAAERAGNENAAAAAGTLTNYISLQNLKLGYGNRLELLFKIYFS